MITIWRYRVRMDEAFTLEMTAPGSILSVRPARSDDRDLEFWATADTESQDKVTRRITIVGTGQPIPDPWPGEYLGTTFHQGGAFVFHVFGAETVPGGESL